MTDREQPDYHTRVRPEASKYAIKNRQTGNWYNHDESHNDINISEFMTIQSVNNTPRIASSRIQNRPQEAENVRRNREKIGGSDEGTNWYNHEKNINYRPPINVRLRSDDAKVIKQKQEMESYTSNISHNVGVVSDIEVSNLQFSRSGINRNQVLLNSGKIRGNHQTPSWFSHPENGERNDDGDLGEDENINLPKTRLTHEDAFAYKDRNVNGYAGEYMIQDENFAEESIGDANDWRPESRVGSHPRAESEAWFHHEERQEEHHQPSAPRRCPSKIARDTYNKSQGLEMLRIFQHVDNSSNIKSGFYAGKSNQINNGAMNKLEQSPDDDVQGHRHNNGRHYLNEAHRKNVVGIMKSIFDQKLNENYSEPAQNLRAVRPEGTFISEKSRNGVMGECMRGYLDNAHKKEIHKSTTNVSEEFLQKQKGKNMAMAILGNLPATNRHQAPRIVKAEGMANAARNRGSLKNLFNAMNVEQNEVEHESYGGTRLRSNEARAIARRYHNGSMKSLLF